MTDPRADGVEENIGEDLQHMELARSFAPGPGFVISRRDAASLDTERQPGDGTGLPGHDG